MAVKVAVLMGGTSSEREVSLRSGQAVARALEGLGYKVVAVDLKTETGMELETLRADVCFIAMHGRFGEDGRLQRLLEDRGFLYTGSGPVASELAMDKLKSKILFMLRRVPTAPYRTLRAEDSPARLELLAEALGYPVVTKPRCEGSSVGVMIHRDASTLPQGLEAARRYGDTCLMEKFVFGREMTVGILDGRALPLIEVRPKREFFDYAAKYQDPDTEYLVNPELPPAVREACQEAALEAHRTLGCEGFSRVDLIVTPDGRPAVLEVNTIPGLTERSLLPKAARAAGLEFPQLCETILKLAFRRLEPWRRAA